ncbi:hypothetical protein GQX73_g8824 [Xylaria multiplex]|uniref:N-acetyltransferase domain-containing protein n=1 Tax=Xylaria multiplex TaxID=323545 RepID=A0A7C8IMG0_9PEZI|nr:hypothetical protein GQX73_g8824 [Xylaria multiplex]
MSSSAAQSVQTRFKISHPEEYFALGYWLGEDHWHQGIATEAVSAFTKWAFDNFDNLLRLEAEVSDGNAAGARVLEKVEFEF